MSKRRPKPRAAPLRGTGALGEAQPGVVSVTLHSWLKVPCKKIEPLKNCARLRFAQECWLPDKCAAVISDEPGDRLLALVAHLWYQW